MSLGTWDTGGDDGQTALLLTQQEWDDLAAIARRFRIETDWVPSRSDPNVQHIVDMLTRQRALAERIIEANQ